MYYIINISTTTEGSAVISDILMDMGSLGISIEDPNDIQMYHSAKGSWDYVDEKELLFDHNDVKVTAYFDENVSINAKIDELEREFSRLKKENFLDFGSLIISKDKIEDEDWANNWKKYFHTQKVSDKIVIKPSWEEYTPSDEELIVDLDPGMAFGTGSHETTRMCIQMMEKYIKDGDNLADIGSGSGVLAMVGALLGAGKVIAIDNDEMAVEVSKENIEKNGLSDKIEVKSGDMAKSVDEELDVIVANIIAEVIIILSRDVKRILKKNGYFISSGIIDEKSEEVLEEIKKNGFEIIEKKQEGLWVCIVAKNA